MTDIPNKIWVSHQAPGDTGGSWQDRHWNHECIGPYYCIPDDFVGQARQQLNRVETYIGKWEGGNPTESRELERDFLRNFLAIIDREG